MGQRDKTARAHLPGFDKDGNFQTTIWHFHLSNQEHRARKERRRTIRDYQRDSDPEA